MLSRGLSLAEALEQCREGLDAEREALTDLATANRDLEHALDDVRHARSPWDSSGLAAAGAVATGVGTVLTCLSPDPTFLTKAACAALLTGGAFALGSADAGMRRQLEITERDLAAAEDDLDRALDRALDAMDESDLCVAHQQLKVSPL